MDERIHEHTTPSDTTCPSAGPTTLFATTTSDHFEKPYSTPRCDEYPTRDKLYPTTNGAISKPRSQSTQKSNDRNILHTSEEEILLQTRSHPYDLPPESTPTTSEATPLQPDNH
jgi:hypothetical protein